MVGGCTSNRHQSTAYVIAKGLLALIRALAGHTVSTSASNAFDSPRFSESEYLEAIRSKAGNYVLTMNW
jgi:hypothetical protein